MKKEKKVEEKDDNNKKILLSVIALLFLVFAVVGVSFAFFTYTRASDENNVITTGQIVFNFDDPDKAPSGKVDPGKDPDDPKDDTVIPGDDLTITNAEPMTDEEGMKQTDQFGFGVDAEIPENLDKLPFRIYAVEGAVPETYIYYAEEDVTHQNKLTGNYYKPDVMGINESNRTYSENDRMDYQFVSLYVAPDMNHSSENVADTIEETIQTPYTKTGNHKLTADVKATDAEKNGTSGGVLIAEGVIPNDGEEYIYSYTMRMWINTDIKVSDTTEPTDGISYRASGTGTGIFPPGKNAETDKRKVYGDLFYSLKIRIEAGDKTGMSH